MSKKLSLASSVLIINILLTLECNHEYCAIIAWRRF